MGFLRAVGLGIIGFVLFAALLLTGVGLTVQLTLLNPSFINNQVEKLDVAELLTEEVVASGAIRDMPDAVRLFLDEELPEYSGELKQAAVGAVDRFYDYILGRSDTLDLPQALGETVFDPQLVYSLADRLDWADLAEEMMLRNLGTDLSPTFSYLTDYIGDAMVKLDGWFHDTLREVVPAFQQYMLGQSDELHYYIDLDEEPYRVIYQTMLDVYNQYPPPELAELSPLQKQMAFNYFFETEIAVFLQQPIDIDSAAFEGAPEALNQAFADLEAEIEQVKTYVGYFQAGFFGLLLGMALLLGLAYLMLRDRWKLMLYAGVVLFVYGLIAFVGIMVTNSVVGVSTDFGQVPAAVQLWLPGVVESATRPLLFFSIFTGALGLAGIILSQVHQHHRS